MLQATATAPRLVTLGNLTMIAAPAGPGAVVPASAPVRTGVTLRLVVESDSGLTALFAGSGAHESASPGLGDRVPMLVDRANVRPKVTYGVLVHKRIVSAGSDIPEDHRLRPCPLVDTG